MTRLTTLIDSFWTAQLIRQGAWDVRRMGVPFGDDEIWLSHTHWGVIKRDAQNTLYFAGIYKKLRATAVVLAAMHIPLRVKPQNALYFQVITPWQEAFFYEYGRWYPLAPLMAPPI